MAITLDGKVAIVTGGGRGIGRGIARVFAREGARVLVVNRSPEAGERTVKEIRNEGGTATLFAGNVESWSDMQGMARACIDLYGRIDVLCLNAAVFPHAMIEDVDETMWDDVMSINLKGVFFGIKACIPQMKRQGSGRIVVVSSITGPNVGWAGRCAYMASKGGVNALVKGAALELARYGVTVNAVSPGTIMTENLTGDLGDEVIDELTRIIPVGYIGDPEDIAYALMFLASDQARFITGQALVIDGGQILPETPAAIGG